MDMSEALHRALEIIREYEALDESGRWLNETLSSGVITQEQHDNHRLFRARDLLARLDSGTLTHMSASDHLSQAQANHVRELHGTTDHTVDRDGLVRVGPPGFEAVTSPKMRLTPGGHHLRVGGSYAIGKYGERSAIE